MYQKYLLLLLLAVWYNRPVQSKASRFPGFEIYLRRFRSTSRTEDRPSVTHLPADTGQDEYMESPNVIQPTNLVVGQ